MSNFSVTFNHNLDGQLGKGFVWFLTGLMIFFVFFSCTRPTDPDLNNPYDEKSEAFIETPDIQTIEVTDIEVPTAISGGRFTSEFGYEISAKGICWSKEENPSLNNECTDEGRGKEDFTSRLTGLEYDTKYYVRSYIETIDGINFGNQIQFGTAGSRKWDLRQSNSFSSSPTIGINGNIYVGHHDDHLYSIDPNGFIRWKFQTGADVESSSAIGSDGTIYVGSEDGLLYAINPDGTLKWKYQTGRSITSSPSIAKDGTVYVGSWDHYVYAINPNGSLKWKFKTGNNVYSSPALNQNGTIFVGSDDNYLYAINPNGSLKWKFRTNYRIRSSPAIAKDGTVYVGSWDNYLYAINPDGFLKWRFQTLDDIEHSPAIDNEGTIIIGSEDNHLYAINPNGTIKWKFQFDVDARFGPNSPVLADNNTIFIGRRFSLYAINTDGSLKWETPSGGFLTSSIAIGSDGTLYIPSSHFLALNSECSGIADSPWPMFGQNAQRTGRQPD